MRQYRVYINSRDRVTPLKQLVDWLLDSGVDPEYVTIVDNDSTYPPLLNYLADCPVGVRMLGQNLGHLAPWEAEVVDHSDYYVVTDPDIVPVEGCPGNLFEVMQDVLDRHLSLVKVGVGLIIEDLPDHYALKRDVINWESNFWLYRFRESLHPELFDAPVDTSMAMYRPGTRSSQLTPACRLGYPYVARHLSWYMDSSNPTEEDIYYDEHALKHITTWTGKDIPDRLKPYLR